MARHYRLPVYKASDDLILKFTKEKANETVEKHESFSTVSTMV